MLDPIEQSLEEHVVLLLIREFHGVLCVEGAHQLAKFFFSDFVAVSSIALEIADKRVVEALLGLLVVLVQDWSLEQVLHECCHAHDRDIVIRSKVEEQSSENLERGING